MKTAFSPFQRRLRCLAYFSVILFAFCRVTSAQLVLLDGIRTFAGSGMAGYSGDGGPASAASLFHPTGITFDTAGNLFFADENNEVIRKIAAGTGVITTVAGNHVGGYAGDGGPATSAELYSPGSVVFDPAGNMYIADTSNNAIRKVSAATGIITTIAGGPLGVGGRVFSLTGNSVLDAAGNLYIAASNLVLKLNATSGLLSTYAGGGTTLGDGGPALSAQFSGIFGIDIDPAGNLYIADGNHARIRKITAVTGIVTTVAGTGAFGYSGDGGPATSATFDGVTSVRLDANGNMFIVSTGDTNLREVNAGTGIITTIAGGGANAFAGDGGPAVKAEFDGPSFVAFDAAGNLYITDTENERIREISAPAIPSTQIGASSVAQNFYLEATAAETIGNFAIPASQGGRTEYSAGAVTGCTADGKTSNAAGTICTVPITFSPAYPGVRAIPLAVQTSTGNVTFGLSAVGVGPLAAIVPGVISTVAGTPGVRRNITGYIDGPGGDGGPATSATFFSPYAVAVDGAGNYYVADAYANDVRKVNILTGIVSNVAGDDALQGGYSGDGGPAGLAQLNVPQGLVVDSAGNVYIADTANYVIRKVSAATGIITTFAGNGTRGNSGDGGPATNASLEYNQSLAVDAADNIYMSDFGDNVVRRINATTGVITTVAGNGSQGFSGDGGLATSAQLNAPTGLAFDPAGNLYILDQNNRVVRKVAAGTGIISTFAGSGSNGSGGDGGAATSAQFGSPQAIATDAAGDVYILDSQVVRKVSAATGIISTVAGIRTNGSTPAAGDGGPATSAGLDGPTGLSISPDGGMLISSGNLYDVRRVSTTAAPLTYATATRIGVADSNDDPQTATLSDIGNAALVLSPPTSGQNPTVSGAWTIENSATCPQLAAVSSAYTLAAGASCSYPVDFKPTAPGANAGTLVVTDNSLNVSAATQTVVLMGTGLAGLSITPTSITFASTVVGGQSTLMSATISNGSNNSIYLTTPTLTDATDFGQTTNCNGIVAPGGSCMVYFAFTPRSPGTLTSTYSVADLNNSTNTLTVPLSGPATAPPITATLAPAVVTFSASTATASATQSATLTNTGTAALAITSITLGGSNPAAFTQTNNCGTTLAIGATCTITLGLVNTSAGSFTALLTVADNATAGNQTATLAGTVTGVPQGSLTPATLTFPSTTVGSTSAAQMITLSNTGTASLTLSTFSFYGTNTSSFAQTNSCPATLAVGASCTVSVTCTPTVAGALSASIAANFPSPTTQVASALSCTGVTPAAPQAGFTPASAAFGTITVGTTSTAQTFTLSNAGNAALSITSISITGSNAFSIAARTCGTSLAAGASCTVSVTFTPTIPGALAATLSVVDPVGIQSSALTGAGSVTLPDFSISATPQVQSSYRGASVTYTIELASLLAGNPYNSAVLLSASGLPSGATATFSPATVTPGASMQTVAMSVSIPALSAKTQAHDRTPEGIAFATLLLGLVCGMRTRRMLPRLLSALLALGLGIAMSGLTGCGNGNGFATVSSTSVITVTATGPATSHSTTVTLTVQ